MIGLATGRRAGPVRWRHTIRAMSGAETSRAESVNRAERLRALPAVGRVLAEARVIRLCEVYGREAVTVQVQREIEALRSRLAPEPADATADDPADVGAEEIAALVAGIPLRVERSLRAHFGEALQRVLNATGIFLHTNLGRAPLPAGVASRLPSFLDAYCDLEMDLAAGRRANRNARCERLLCALTGAEAALVVNNNAAALVLLLQCLASGREVVVSRGELVEIGGSFRVPSILEAAGARLVEVGTTNRTRAADYAGAITERTGALLKVNPSNYRMTGFVEEVTAAELVALGRRHEVPVLVDEGSGLLRASRRPQLRSHPSLQELVACGVDAACGSGDKLVGGPQAGLIVGRSEIVSRLARHPLYRALRPDRSTLFALEAVLRMHLAGEELPLGRLWDDSGRLEQRLERLADRLGAEIVDADAYMGGGAAPEAEIPGRALALPGTTGLLERLRRGSPPVVGYLREGQLLLDLRTVAPEDDAALAEAVERALEEAETAT